MSLYIKQEYPFSKADTQRPNFGGKYMRVLKFMMVASLIAYGGVAGAEDKVKESKIKPFGFKHNGIFSALFVKSGKTKDGKTKFHIVQVKRKDK